MRRHKVLFLCVFYIPLMVLAAMTLLRAPKAFSVIENRPLAQMPVLSLREIQAGSAQEKFSAYLSDQVPFRDFWIKENTFLKRLFGRKEINGIYFGDDNYYFQQFTDDSYSYSRMTALFRMMDNFIKRYDIPTTVMLVPSPGTVLPDKLPIDAPYYDDDIVFDTAEQLLSCSVIDLRNTFETAADSTQLFYRTDHHWTSQGAYLAYEQYCSACGYYPQKYTLEQVSDDFYGTLYSKTLDSTAIPDSVYAPVELPAVTITYEDGTVSNTPYRHEKLEQKDQYAYFFGGNFGKLTIHTQAQNKEKILVIKDSFANSFVPFLFGDYSEIIMLDMRYFGGSVEDVIVQKGVTQILFLYETSNLLTDTGILRLQK